MVCVFIIICMMNMMFSSYSLSNQTSSVSVAQLFGFFLTVMTHVVVVDTMESYHVQSETETLQTHSDIDRYNDR